MALSGDLVGDDDYVTKLLVEDARRSSMRYASQGLSALLPKRPPGSAPKPNTRFLKTLVREADSHNAKLKEKEEYEARIRLKRIRDAEQGSKKVGCERETEGRHDQERKRRRLCDDKGSRTDERERARDLRRSRSPEQRRERHDGHKRGRRRRHETDEPDEDSNHRRTRHRNSSHRARSRSRSKSRSRERKEEERHKKDRQRHRHERKSRRHSPPTDPDPEGQKDVKHGTRTPSISSTSTSSDDPLSYLIGPRPTPPDNQCPQRRGRGFRHGSSHQSRSNIDAHFSPTYDPSTHDAGVLDSDDLNPEDEGGDQDEWTAALSALRDRRAWRAKQAERMKDAGFSEEEIKRWEKSASSRTLLAGNGDGGEEEGNIRDVRWRKKGEEREWDVGKERNTSPSPSDHGVVDKAHETAREGGGGAKNEKKTIARGVRVGADSAWRRPQNAFLKQFKSALR
ncbi:uncharacterized protein Z519_08975 [Cladophialophora bantiana CBS 173.52]|uniref:Uncharacterized protein n=1 Tax=Cladophialophora bantiana (strain ATCC 10958 / CBS 173.52 / CDC B-1940 / NIH 8579) TaxID=1442370 RepID=A0A0D2EJZ4_CLAB1|nr:uncharacterized protein Z519_08975 [Cladophialophora bantiana CBS 173.52]KIW90331.1 hypothetical protein Z519_08975 [Cladophialophora bantiana CBS 173.52]